jgi:hypothetical protein
MSVLKLKRPLVFAFLGWSFFSYAEQTLVLNQCETLSFCGPADSSELKDSRIEVALECVAQAENSYHLISSRKNLIQSQFSQLSRAAVDDGASIESLLEKASACHSDMHQVLDAHRKALDVATGCGAQATSNTEERNKKFLELSNACDSLLKSLQAVLPAAPAAVETVDERRVEASAPVVRVAQESSDNHTTASVVATVPAPDATNAPVETPAVRVPAATSAEPVVSARMASSDSSRLYVGLLTSFAAEQQRHISAVRQRRNTDLIDSGDQRVVQDYYNQVREHYIARPLNDLTARGVPAALEEYIRSVNTEFGATRSSAEDIARMKRELRSLNREREDVGTSDVAKRREISEKIEELESQIERAERSDAASQAASQCILRRVDVSHLNNQSRQAAASLDVLSTAARQPYDIRSLDSHPQWGNNERNALVGALNAFEAGRLAKIVEECCQGNRTCIDQNIAVATRIDNRLADRMHAAVQEAPRAGYIPNPAAIDELKAKDLVDIISQKKNVLTSLRSGTQNDEYADEMDVFESMARCRIRAKQYQSDKVPMSHQALSAIGQTVKCGILPFWATQNWDTKWQQLSTGIAAAEVRGQGWDMSCDANEMEAWNMIAAQGRDPNNWGLPQMANPPYLQSMRQVAPVSTGLPGRALTADEFLMMTPTPGLENIDTTAGELRTAGRTTNAASGVRLGSRTTAGAGSLLAAQISRSERGVRQGQGLVQSVRTASAEIRNGNQAEYYSERLRTGARETSNVLATSVSRVQNLPASAQSQRNQQTDVARNQVLRSVGTSASRTTSEGILNGLQGRGTPPSSVSDVGQRNRQVREEVKAQIQKHLNNIEDTRKKGEQARAEILRLVAEHDSKMLELEMEIQGKPPATIQQKIASKRQELLEVVKQIGVYKASYDAYQAAILEQNSALHRLATFGPQNMELRIGGRGDTRGASSTASGVDTSGMPAGYTPAGRGSVQGAWLLPKDSWLQNLWTQLNPIATAWASSRSALLSAEEYWASEWKRFVSQYETYVQGRRRADEANSREAAKLVAARKASIDRDSYMHIDLETLTTMDMFISELEQETEFLLDGHRSRQFVLSPAVLRDLQIAREEATKARQSWAQAQVLGFQQMPRSYEQSPELWWGLLTQVFMQ